MSKIELFQGDGDKFLSMKPSQLTGDAKWKDIEDLINRWARRNPRGAWEMDQTLKEIRGQLTDQKYAKLNKEAMGDARMGLSLHPELLQYIEAFYPKFLSTKNELHEFQRRFPKFSIPEKV